MPQKKQKPAKPKKTPSPIIQTDGSRQSFFSLIKKGEVFKFPNGKKIYIFNGGGPVKGYNYVENDDISGFHSTKTDREIVIGFDY